MNDRGEYDAAHRGAVRVGRDGVYRFQTNRPRSFEGRQGHIHMLVRAPGHRLLLTEHFPRAGRAQGRFDLVIPTLPGV